MMVAKQDLHGTTLDEITTFKLGTYYSIIMQINVEINYFIRYDYHGGGLKQQIPLDFIYLPLIIEIIFVVLDMLSKKVTYTYIFIHSA